MRNKAGILFMIIGAALILGALSLFLFNQQEAAEAQQAAVELLPQLIQKMEEEQAVREETEEPRPVQPLSTPVEFLEPEDLEMPEEVVGMYAYIGYLSVPQLGQELPAMADWDHTRLQIAPCRFTGNLYEDNLVIMAHNYESHFADLQELRIGDIVTFTVIEGETTEYEVVALDVLEPTDVDEMIDGFYDLTLFTCTYGGKSRVTVRCNRT